MTDILQSPPRRGRRVMICVRGQCAESGLGRKLETQLNTLIEQHGLDDPDHPQHVTCQVTNCLGVCSGGPVLIVHPGATKYHHVDPATLERIFHEHLRHGQPVEAFMVKYPTSQPILKQRQPLSGKKRKRGRWW